MNITNLKCFYFTSRIIKAVEQRLKTANKQHKAILLQTLAQTGTLQGLQEVKLYAQDRRVSKVFRTSAISALRLLSKFYPQQVLDVVLPIYNNREELTIVRVAAASTLLSSNPTYPILEKMAVDLTREPNREVGSFVSSSLLALANATVPCLRSL